MSLYLGNLSSRIRRDDLERVFRKFGRNIIQMKDGYGFVVYDLPENAEKALKALRGKKICGEWVSLTWSNKQPIPFPRFSRGSRFYEPPNGRNFTRREDYATREETSHHGRGFERVTGEPDGEVGEPHMDDFLDEGKVYPHDDDVVDNEGNNFENVKESVMDEGFPIESNLEDNGRWGELVSDSLDRKEVENGASLDLCETYHGCDRRDEDDNRYRATPYGSSARGSSGEKSRRDRIVNTIPKHSADSKYLLKCYICGVTGHIRRNCPRGNAFWQEKFSRFDQRRDGDASLRVRGKRGRKRVSLASRRRFNHTRSLPSRHNKRGSSHGFRKPPRLVRDESSPSAKGRESQIKRKRQREDGDSVIEGRATKRVGSPLKRSDSTGSTSWMRSTSSGIRSCSRSRSRSISSKTDSVSSGSRSMSTSSKSTSENSRSRSVSTASLSLSVSLSHPLQSSPSKADKKVTLTSPKDHLEEDNRSTSEQFLIDQRQKVVDDANTENSKVKCSNGTLLDESRLSSLKGDHTTNMNHHRQLYSDAHHEVDEIEHELKGPFLNPSEKGTVSVDNLSSDSSGERKDLKKSGAPEMEDTAVSYEEQNVDVPSPPQSKNSTSISSQEMYMVLKHYGLAIPNESDANLSMEDYFGSARLWPWEIIYYRRLKKGPISTENYAQRIAQNEEFGIVDKYVRSSSGWGEC